MLKLPKITEGPWNVAPWSKEFDGYGDPGKCGVDSPTVAVAITNGLPDARAIAAVPALLEALLEVVEWNEASVRRGGKLSAGQVLGRASAFGNARAALLLAGATEEE